MDQHEAAAADIARARQRHREREADRDGGVDRVAAALENIEPDPRGRGFLRDHHGVRRDDGPRDRVGRDDLLGIGERGRRNGEDEAGGECGSQEHGAGIRGHGRDFERPGLRAKPSHSRMAWLHSR